MYVPDFFLAKCSNFLPGNLTVTTRLQYRHESRINLMYLTLGKNLPICKNVPLSSGKNNLLLYVHACNPATGYAHASAVRASPKLR